MIHLPSLKYKTMPRPNRPLFEQTYIVPNEEEYRDFWKDIYVFMRGIEFKSPVMRKIKKLIDTDSGFFGFRVHPVTQEPKYFHAGISLELDRDDAIFPMHPGVLEYSGYGAVNGYYVLLSHPNIVTEDGYVFHTMYCHLKKPLVKFNSYQKMLREISLGSHPIVPVDIDVCLGHASTSGVAREQYPGLYFECSFRKFDEIPIVIDPLQLYYVRSVSNKTAEIIHPKKIKKTKKR